MIRRGHRFARSLRWLGVATVAGLGAFHADLLRQRLVDASIGEPTVALRWLGTGLLLAGLGALARRGVPLFRDRRALGLWAAALLLHIGTTPAIETNPEWLALPAVAVVSLAGAELASAVGGGRLRLLDLAPIRRAGGERRRPSPLRPRRRVPSFLPRPPPALR